MVFHPFYISFSATLSRTSFDTVRNDLDLQVCDKSGPGSSYSRHRRECSKRRGVEPRGGRGKEGRRLERNSSHRFHASPRFMKRDNRNTGWDTLWIRWNRIVSSPWTKLSSSTVEAASIYIYTHTAMSPRRLSFRRLVVREAWRDFAAKEQVPFSSGRRSLEDFRGRRVFVFLLPPGEETVGWLGRATSFLPRSVKSLYTVSWGWSDGSVCLLSPPYVARWWRRESDLVTFFLLENHSRNLI